MTKKIILAALLVSGFISTVIGGNDPENKKEKFDFNKKLFSKSKRSSEKLFEIGTQLSMLKLLGSGSPNLMGFGVNVLFSPNGEKNAFFGEFNYYLPGTQTNSDYADALSSTTDPSQIDITVNTKVSGMGFRFGYRRYIIQEVSEDGFKMYFQATAGLLLFKGTSSTSTSFDPNLYSTSFEPTSTASGFTLGGGLGAEYLINSKVNIFAECNLNVPANSVNGQAVEVEIPLSLQTVIGLRIRL